MTERSRIELHYGVQSLTIYFFNQMLKPYIICFIVNRDKFFGVHIRCRILLNIRDCKGNKIDRICIIIFFSLANCASALAQFDHLPTQHIVQAFLQGRHHLHLCKCACTNCKFRLHEKYIKAFIPTKPPRKIFLKKKSRKMIQDVKILHYICQCNQ